MKTVRRHGDGGGASRRCRRVRPRQGHEGTLCLATSFGNNTARQIVDAYARRWTVEPSFRDTKDIRFGMGMALLRISRPDRRDRLLLLNAFAMHLLTMLGTAGEELGMGPSAQVRHKHAPHAFPFPPGLHALRTHPQHARGPSPTPHAALRRGDATIKRNPEAGCGIVI